MYWRVKSRWNEIGYSAYQIVLNEGSPDITFNYGEDYGAGSGGINKTMVGIENGDGSIGLRYPGFNKPGQYKRRTVRFYLGTASSPVDRDKDGYNSDVDCNDNNPAIHPGAKEICGDGIDNNCNGQIDEGCGFSTEDHDGDGYTEAQGDCNDNNPKIYPGAAEFYDGIDNNCNGEVDEEICGDGIDNNGNGWGDEICNVTPKDRDNDGYTEAQGDCDDTNPNIHPGAKEICGDKIDNNCNGLIDENCNVTPKDQDGDGYTEAQGDCNDNNPKIHPGAREICGDGIDNNCNGKIDEDCSNDDPGNGDNPDGEGPDTFGYRYLTSNDPGGPVYEWEAFTKDAQRISFRADAGLQSAIPANGFFYKLEADSNPPFEFYGEQYSRVYIAGNGYLVFSAKDTNYTNFTYDGQEFPAVDKVNNLIAPLWLGGQSAANASTLVKVVYETLGEEPQRRFVMQFNRQDADGHEIAYQVVFYEGENTIKFNYKSIGSLDGEFFVAGIENGDGSTGLRYADLEKPVEVKEQSVLFYRGDPPDDANPTATIYMPLVMSGNNWQTSVVLLNSSDATVTGTLRGHNGAGKEIFTSTEITLQSRAQSQGLLSDFFGTSDLTGIAYLSFVSASNAVVGSVHLKVRGQGMAGAYPAQSSLDASNTLFLPTVIVGAEGWGNIVSLINTGDDTSRVKVEFDNGATKFISLKPGQQFYFYPVADMEVLSAQLKLMPLKQTTPAPTSAVISGGEGLLGAVLFYHGEKLSAMALDNHASAEIIYPYLLDGSGWWGGLAFYNPGNEAGKMTFTGFLGDGNPVKLALPWLSLGKLQSRSIASHELVAGGVGWLRVKADAPIAGMEFFGTSDYRQLASVATGALQGRSGVFSHLRSGEDGGWSGLLLNNPSPVKNKVALTAYDADGNKLAETSRDIPANGQLLSEINALFEGTVIEGADFETVVSISFTAERDIVGVVFNGRNYKDGDYSMEELEALPPLSVPHLVGLY